MSRCVCIVTCSDPFNLSTFIGVLVATPGVVELFKRSVAEWLKPRWACGGPWWLDKLLGAFLGWSQGTFASEVAVAGDTATITREVDGGLQTISLKMPAIITVDLRLNDPRYASLPNIMKAKAKPMAMKVPADYGVDVSPRLAVLKTVEPAGRKAGVKVGSVDELIAKLRDEAGVI